MRAASKVKSEKTSLEDFESYLLLSKLTIKKIEIYIFLNFRLVILLVARIYLVLVDILHLSLF